MEDEKFYGRLYPNKMGKNISYQIWIYGHDLEKKTETVKMEISGVTISKEDQTNLTKYQGQTDFS
jgi:hypothetical protein